MLVWWLLAIHAAQAQTARDPWRLSVLASSDYQRYGISQTDSAPALRFLADYEHASGFFAGGFATNVEYSAEQNFANARNSEVSVYAGRSWRGSNWVSHLSISRYIYPDIDFDYDYSQVSASVGARDRYFFEATVSNDYLSVYGSSIQYSAGLAFPLLPDAEVGLNAGRFRYDKFGGNRFSFWDVGVSRIFAGIAWDIRYHDSTYDRSSLLGSRGDDRWVLSATYVIAPRSGQAVPR